MLLPRRDKKHCETPRVCLADRDTRLVNIVMASSSSRGEIGGSRC